MTKPIQPSQTQAFYLQAILSFGVSITAMTIAIVYLPAAGWIRAFLALGLLYLVTSTVTLCKVVRDRQELSVVTNRVDQARLDKLLADHDPFKVEV
ncbi:YiaA/YiaB family inner membrane protein [Kribbella sp. CA-293567]|uniref:YiaA/YiaB family inner membrane protein n=1 Tax=Kribbella sp. CA-293567 TaxID=3002436 RepID=UPI0022DE23C4|nr:YiaA/YiaB family inner membrane protein [Kribbella sp. CA-293567]WBQ04008.1 YiaA/YiaB family inner membrane protein [Kribbella sp. CA-293567]